MTEAQSPHDETRDQSAEEAWREVGQQFETLGESLSTAFRAAWESEETQQHVQSMQSGLEKLVDRVDRAVKEAGESEKGQRIRAEAQKTAESLRYAGEQTWEDVRPQLLNALTKANAELERFIERMEQRETSESEGAGPPGGEGGNASTVVEGD